MPVKDDVSRLHHMLEAADDALVFIIGKQRSDLDTDKMLVLALVRLLEIIGEAAAGISEEMRSEYPEIAWRQMSAMRNRLIHGYFEVNLDIVWKTLKTELPPLASQLRKVLENETP
jgi:uncharacterized protein with HEPN domain